jgi:hypothetical protein
MKKGMKKLGLVLALFSFMLLMLTSFSLVSGLTVSTTDYSSTLTGVKISDAENLYSYEINFVVISGSPSVSFADKLAKDGAETTNGSELKEINGANILAAYESILDPESPGVNLTDDYVFNVTHSGTIVLRQIISVDGSQNEETENLCTETLSCGAWSSCVGGVQTRICQSLVCHYDNTTQVQSCGSSPTPASTGGGGGGSSATKSIKVEFGTPDIQESGYVEVPVSIVNSGTTSFNDITISAYLKKNGEVVDSLVSLSKTSFASLIGGTKEDLTVSANIRENDVNFYELVVQVNSKTPEYSDSGKILFTFVGKEGGKVLKVVAFTSGLIEEHPECLELQDMIVDAQNEFNKGNTQLALQKANQAVAACKSYLESPLKPIITQKQYDKIPLYLGIGITVAILFGIIFNLYISYRFKR